MRYFSVLLLLLLSVCASAAELPGRIFLKTGTQGFTHEYDVAVHEGKLWYKSGAAGSSPWQMLGKTGLPGSGNHSFVNAVSQISADGDNLIAIGDDGIVYYMKWSTRKWVKKWGQPVSSPLRLPDNIRAWSISHRGPFAGGYSDIDGNFHAISVGVTTLYVLSEDGLTISYADPWLPADFSHEIGGPLQNRFRARSLAASASTLFVISDAGDMYTRLADYDTLGLNPFLAYSYERRTRDPNVEKDVRTLPPEDWKKQPSIPQDQGRITSAITILQTGRGNDARELRVEGVNAQGVHGFFAKALNADTWQFTQTGLPLQRPLLDPGKADEEPGPVPARNLSGRLQVKRTLKGGAYPIELQAFHPLCPGATLIVDLGDEKVQLPLSIAASSSKDVKMKGAILLPPELKSQPAKSQRLQKFLGTVFGKHSFVKIKLNILKNETILIKAY